jgi:hypothetical protein
MHPGLIELFVDGKEDGLPDSGRLDGLGLGEGSAVFLLQRAGWHWTACGKDIVLSGEGLVATVANYNHLQLATGGEPMTEGRHYWEVEITKWGGVDCLVGAVRPGLDHDKYHFSTNDAYLIDAFNGGLWGNGKEGDDGQGEGLQAEGDRVGVLLDLDAGWLRFYRDGKRCGPGFTKGVTGPLVRAAQVHRTGDTLTVLPAAVAPEGAGAVDEPWEGPEADY